MSATPQASPQTSVPVDAPLGPIDIVVIAYPPGAPITGSAAPLLVDLVDRGIIRVLDALFVTKDEDGTVAGFEARNLDEGEVGDFVVFEGVSSGLLGHEDAAQAGAAIDPGAAALVIVFENKWAAPFAAAVRSNGGEVLDYQRIPVGEVLDALEAAEQSS